MQISLTVFVIIVVGVVGFFGGLYFKGQTASNNKANNISEEEKAQDFNLEKEIPTENIEVVKEEVTEDVIKEEPKEEIETAGKIVLSGNKTSSGVKLSWTTNNLGSLDGFKLVKAKEANPTYPGSEYVYLTDKNTRVYSWEINAGSKYHFRVCQYVGGKCVLYSNDIYLDTPTKDDDSDGEISINLSATKSGEEIKLSWKVSGKSPHGFKVVIDTEKNPVYPGNDYHYYPDPDKRSDIWEKNLKEGKTYYFRVCEYNGSGKCLSYSNNAAVSF